MEKQLKSYLSKQLVVEHKKNPLVINSTCKHEMKPFPR